LTNPEKLLKKFYQNLAAAVNRNHSSYGNKRLAFTGGFPTRFARWIIRLSFSKNEKQVSFITGVALAGLKNQSGCHSPNALWRY